MQKSSEMGGGYMNEEVQRLREEIFSEFDKRERKGKERLMEQSDSVNREMASM